MPKRREYLNVGITLQSKQAARCQPLDAKQQRPFNVNTNSDYERSFVRACVRVCAQGHGERSHLSTQEVAKKKQGRRVRRHLRQSCHV